jgi:hypothetical protein
MGVLPDRQQQILAFHGDFIRQLVEASQTHGREADVQTLLLSARQNGWEALAEALKKIVSGQQDRQVFNGLDEEDQVIAEAVLRGIQDPSTLPESQVQGDPTLAAPGIASMVQAAASGNVQALQLVANMAEQMSKAGGDMARLAAIIRPLINGERNADRLCQGMSTAGEQLVLNILTELGQNDVH